jgi:hypothetical protein
MGPDFHTLSICTIKYSITALEGGEIYVLL